MLKTVWVIRLKHLHDASGKTMYRVAKDLGIRNVTVARYVQEDVVEMGFLDVVVSKLAHYYGVDWRDVVTTKIVDVQDPEYKSPLIA